MATWCVLLPWGRPADLTLVSGMVDTRLNNLTQSSDTNCWRGLSCARTVC